MKFLLLALALLNNIAFATPPAKGYQPEALRTLISHSQALVREGRHPVVMFDLDDTLINTRERTLRILQDFARSIQSENGEVADKILSLQANQVQFLMSATLLAAGVNDPSVLKRATDFWLARFFTNEFSAKDVQNPGAAEYLRLLEQAGAEIVYLTGRDEPRMGEGTRASILANHFPLEGEKLILKPDQAQDDLKFKESQYGAVAALGEVIGAFENEPANINSMARAFPQAQAIFLDTIHSPTAEVPMDRVEWVPDFYLP